MTADDTAELSRLSREDLIQRLLMYKSELESERAEFEELKTTSDELQHLLEQEVDDYKKKSLQFERRCQTLDIELSRAQERFQKEKQELLKIENDLRAQVQSQKKTLAENIERIRKLEQLNDDLERSDRNNQQLTKDLAEQLNTAMERALFLESDIANRQSVAEEMLHIREVREEQKERPRQVVEPLRIDKIEDVEAPEEPTPAKLNSEPEDMEETRSEVLNETLPEEVHDDNLKQVSEVSSTSARVSTCVNRLMKDMIVKIDRLESLLSRLKTVRS